MAFPTTVIIISPNGDSRIEGIEKEDSCSKLSELARQAGIVVTDDSKDHKPVYQAVIQRKKRKKSRL
jgi:hypothetical protein